MSAIFSRRPVAKLSTPRTTSPRCNSSRAIEQPMNPAMPVIRYLAMIFQVEMIKARVGWYVRAAIRNQEGILFQLQPLIALVQRRRLAMPDEIAGESGRQGYSRCYTTSRTRVSGFDHSFGVGYC